MMDISSFTCRCGNGYICILCRMLLLAGVALIAGAIGYFIAKKSK